jgi:hypothetical protein
MSVNRLFTALVAALSIWAGQAIGATTLLPPGKQCWADINGPLAAGTVDTYIPSTTTRKTTWQDSGQIATNANPIILDGDGCAIIYGTGSYRTVVTRANTSVFFDGVTADTSAFNSVFWAGTSAGTPNVITVVYSGFNGTDGTVIQFKANATNTGSVTLNPSAFGATLIQKDTTAGPVSLSGGEIIAGNIISVVYVASTSSFHLLNAVIASASGGSNPLCGASGLQITNGGTPNTQIAVTANQALTQSNTGVINRSSVSVSISTGTVGANGLDAGTVAASTWYYVWLIDNGSAIAGLASLSSTAPTMPSGYTYKCRVGAMQTDGSSNLYRMLQVGNGTQYKITAGVANNTVVQSIANGVAGTYSSTSPTLATATVRGNAFCAPSTATRISVVANNNWKSGASSNVIVAPTTAWGGANNGEAGSAGQSYPIALASTTNMGAQATLVLEADTIAWASNAAGAQIGCLGYTDAVNVN